MEWTQQQAEAIYLEGKNLIVSAAAGSGKTAILTERIVRLICEGADIESFLVVTFTEAATNEMKRRIASRLMQAASQQPGEAARLRAQAQRVGRANISTLHAFCLYILRRQFHLLGLDPAFTAADAILSDLLFQEALEQAAEEAFARADAARASGAEAPFLLLMRAVNGKEQALFGEAGRLHTFLFAQPNPWGFLDAAIGAYRDGDALAHNPAMEELLEDGRLRALGEVNRLLRARAHVPRDEAFVKTLALLDEDMASIRQLSLSHDIADYRERLLAVEFPTFRWPRKLAPEQKDIVMAARDEVKKNLRAQQKLFARPLEEEAERMLRFLPVMEALADFVRAVDGHYTAKKRARGKVDFNDMEHLALRALEDEAVRAELRERFRYVFVDEYQDSSRIQECILERVRGENNLFLVGDVKQSIYRFRQAEPTLFLEKLDTYTGEKGVQVHLNTNFRSEQPVLDAVNTLFSRVMSEAAGELQYDARAMLYRLGDAPPSALAGVEFHLLDEALAQEAPGEEAEDEEELRPETAEAEAIFAAQRIRELMKTEQYVENGVARPLHYQDFAVLLRSHRAVGEIWAATLAREGVPAYVQLTGGYFDAIEVQVFLNLLRIVDNRRQDIPLASALRSPVFGFDEEMLLTLTTDYEGDTLFDRLHRCAQGEGALSSRAAQVINTLAVWRREARLLPLPEFITWLLDESGLYEAMGALTAGRERQANLDALAVRAREYVAAGGASDIYSFLHYMDGAKSSAQMGAAQAGAADVVRVLSMHRAKGLEFPVVLLAGLSKPFNRRDERAPLLYDSALGIGARLIIGGVRRDTFLRRAIAARIRRKSTAEEMRVLYVAMTRARSRLLLIASVRGAQARVSAARDEELTPAYCLRARAYLDWLLPASTQTDALPLSIHSSPKRPTQEEAARPPEEADVHALLSALHARFSWRYPYAGAVTIPTKLSVSELLQEKQAVFRDPPSFSRPERRLSAAQRGTAIHAYLHGMRLLYSGSPLAHAKAEADALLSSGLLTQTQRRAIPLRDIAWYLQTPLYERLLHASRVERELEFSTELPARLLIQVESEEPILLQGVIDCCFFEDGGWVLIDYKTDRIQESPEQDAQKHAPQLRLYALALRHMTKAPVKEACVVMLRGRSVIAVETP